MQGSRVAKVATVGVLTVLFLAGMWMAAGSANPFEGVQRTFTVPTGQFGDRATYDMQSFGGDLSEERVFSWRFEGPETTVDRSGHPHDVASIQVDTDKQDGWGWPMKSFLDLSTRQVIRYEGDYDTAAGEGLLFPYVVNSTSVVLGPVGAGYPTMESFRFAATAQGRTFTIGDDVSDRVGFFGPHPYADLDFGQQVRVIGTGMLGDIPVWSVHAQVWERDSWTENGRRVTGRVYENVTFWFSETKPVPLRIDYETIDIDPDGTRFTAIGAASLSSFESGSKPIPWGSAPPSDAPPPNAVRSTTSYPRSGVEFRGPFRIEDAILSVESDPTLVAFTAWKNSNPDARLVGIEGKPGRIIVRNETGGYLQVLQPFGDTVPMWNLRYSSPFGATVMMVSSYRDDDGRTVNVVPDADGEPYAPALRFDPAWLPDSLVVLHEADKFWKTLVDEATYDLGPNYVQWGYNYPLMTNPEAWMSRIMYGRHSTNLAPGELNPIPGEALIEAAVIDAATGQFDFGWRKATWPALESPLASNGANQEAVVGAPNTGLGLVPLAAAAASASLVVLLAVYLYPLLQQGAIGLYTKLVKHQLLDNQLRDHLVTLIRENPGISPPALKHLTGAGWSTITYHLSVLRDNNLATSIRDGRHRRYFLVGAVNHSSMAEIAVLRNATTRHVFEVLSAQPGIDRETLGRLVGLTKTPTIWHLQRLERSLLLRIEKRGRTFVYFAARPDAARELSTMATGVPA